MFFFIALGLYTGMEATPKAPQGYHLWKRRLRAPTRDTFAYAKRLREESRKDLFYPPWDYPVDDVTPSL